MDNPAQPQLIRSGGRFERIHHCSSVPSTNDLAFDLARRGEVEGTIVTADQQTDGRGRLGRTWLSPPDLGLYASVILRPDRPLGEWTDLSWIVAGATADALLETGAPPLTVKYPNDLLCGRGKLAGILLESRVGGDLSGILVAGIGINLHHRLEDFPPDLTERATSLFLMTGRLFDAEALSIRLQSGIAKYYDIWREKGPEPVRTALRRLGVTFTRADEALSAEEA